jgi:hypothetical protein
MAENIETHQERYERETRVVEDAAAERRIAVSKVVNFIWLLFGILEGLIGLRVFLKLIAANPRNPFANLLYQFTALFLWPFRGLTADPSGGGIVLEVNSLIAMMVYGLLGWVIVRLIWLIFYRPPTKEVTTYSRRNRE